MASVADIARQIVDREGGFVNDPDDPGGATKYGVTLKTLRRLGWDLDKDGDSDIADLHALRLSDATEIFIHHYYYLPRIDALPASLQPSVFDMNVNAGSNAVRILQRLLRDMGHPIAVDGVIGPATIAAAKAAEQAAPEYLRDAYGIARRAYYFRLADRRRASRKYVRTRQGGKGGWIRRAEEFISPRYHMDAAQFRERVASWG